MTCNCKTKCNPCRCGLAEGERRKADALSLLEARREVYVLRGRRALLNEMLLSGTATADVVRDAVELPVGMDPKLFGSVPGALARACIIRQVGFAKTCRPEGHARPVALWELVDREAAVQWLADHPDAPDPAGAERSEFAQGVLFPTHAANEPTPVVAATGAVGK